MKLFNRLIWVALALALLVGTLQTVLQQAWAVPIILQAETFENQKAEPVVVAGHSHAEEAEAWAPQDGAERTFWTWVANVLHGFGMALLVLVALGVWVWRRGAGTSTWALALAIAVGGFVSLHLWPALGLHAEIPGMDAARLGSRQGWWLLAAGAALAACATLALSRRSWRWVVAAAWLAVPFAVGAPHITADPLAGFGPEAQVVLRELGRQFIWVTYAMAASLWLSLGAAGAWAFVRWVQPLCVDQPRAGENLSVHGLGA
jgi:cobalt transporter subunit CbtA